MTCRWINACKALRIVPGSEQLLLRVTGDCFTVIIVIVAMTPRSSQPSEAADGDPPHHWRGCERCGQSAWGVMAEPLSFHCGCWNIFPHSHLTTLLPASEGMCQAGSPKPPGPWVLRAHCPCLCEVTQHSVGISLPIPSPGPPGGTFGDADSRVHTD